MEDKIIFVSKAFPFGKYKGGKVSVDYLIIFIYSYHYLSGARCRFGFKHSPRTLKHTPRETNGPALAVVVFIFNVFSMTRLVQTRIRHLPDSKPIPTLHIRVPKIFTVSYRHYFFNLP